MDAATPLPTPIVVIPGNPASNLWDLYLTQPDPTYTLSRGGFPLHKPSNEKNYDRLPFHPDDPTVTLNTTGRAVSPARLAAFSAFYLPYEDLVERLKQDVGTDDMPAPVFPFAYDWRYDTSVSARQLGAFIDEVLRITSLLPAYKAAPPTAVDLVGHSFGGLVLSRYLRSCQTLRRPARVRKVVTIATPFRGAVDALFAMIKDLEQRVAARALPSVWGLLPCFPNAAVDMTKSPPVPVDLLTDATIWNGSSVERTLDAYCKAMGSAKTGAERLSELQAQADQQRSDITTLDVASVLDSPDDWMPIVGIGCKTNAKIEVVKVQPGSQPDAEFSFVQVEGGGDNTVPYLGAIPPFNLATGAPGKLTLQGNVTPPERLVCFTEDDIGLHERGDWLGIGQTLGLVSLHSFMPKMDAVQQTIFGFLRASPPKVKARARPAPDVGNVLWPESWNVRAGTS
jgi:pimeloyl-ACP methyl ester carboxylesterase